MRALPSRPTGLRVRLSALLVAAGLTLTGLTGIGSVTSQAQAVAAPVTNLKHLDFLLDQVAPPAQAGHTTYRLGQEPRLTLPWTYANVDADAVGGYTRVGGGDFDPSSGDYGQGAFNTDDITRAAVVYLRDWRVNHHFASLDKAYELLRSVAYFQTTTGSNAGRSVLWMQPDGVLNPSATPPEPPDPSDSGPSYWQARTLWAYGEGYAAFRTVDPAFARFLQQRLRLSLAALDRDVLTRYGHYVVADGVRLPGWLILNGADVTAEAVLGLSAYLEAAPQDRRARRILTDFGQGIAQLSAGDAQSWPYGAILPSVTSRSSWHAWASQTSAALARSSKALHRPALLTPAVKEAVDFDTTVLTAGGPDNGWNPTPTDQTQIAYGVDSRVQSLLATADVGHLPALRELAGMQAAWLFGANRAGAAMYDPSTGVTFDGLAADGTVNRNSGAESTIHGLLTMLALDAHPSVRTRAREVASVQVRAGLRVVEAESTTSTTGTVVRPANPGTGESQYGGGAYLELAPGQRASFDLGPATQPRLVEPVSWLPEHGKARSRWLQGRRNIGLLHHRVGAQGVTAVPGALLPQQLHRAVVGSKAVSVVARRGSVSMDALIVRPLVSVARFTGPGGSSELVHSASTRSQDAAVGSAGVVSIVRSYDNRARLVSSRNVNGPTTVRLEPGGFAFVSS